MAVPKLLIYVSVAALVLALLPLPYGYYMLLRIGMCGVLAYLASLSLHARLKGLTWVLGCAALVYNPIAPLHLGRDVWLIVNLLTIVLLLFTISKSTLDNP